jgi:hypothetical protein
MPGDCSLPALPPAAAPPANTWDHTPSVLPGSFGRSLPWTVRFLRRGGVARTSSTRSMPRSMGRWGCSSAAREDSNPIPHQQVRPSLCPVGVPVGLDLGSALACWRCPKPGTPITTWTRRESNPRPRPFNQVDTRSCPSRTRPGTSQRGWPFDDSKPPPHRAQWTARDSNPMRERRFRLPSSPASGGP